MPSTYTLNNGIELIATGEQSGTWGDTTNTNLELLDTALDGQVTVTLASAGTSGSPNTLPISDGAASNGRNRLVIFNDGVDLGATAYVQLTPNDAEKIIYVRNSLSGSRSILLFQGTYNASNDYEVPAGTTAVIYFDGAGSGAVAANVFNNAHFDAMNVVGNVEIGGTLSVTGETTVSANVNFGDNNKAIFGAGSDLTIFSDGGTFSYINNTQGVLRIRNTSDDQDVVIQSDNGSGGVTDYFTADGSTGAAILHNYGAIKLATTSTGIDVTGDATFADNGKAIFGAGSDLQIYHNGTDSFIDETNATGWLYIRGNNTVIGKYTGETYFKGIEDGAVELYYDNAIKLATTTTGIDVTGTVTADGLTVDTTAPIIELAAGNNNDSRLVFSEAAADIYSIKVNGTSGTLQDFTIYHDITSASTARFQINQSGDISFYEDTGTTAKFFWDASAERLGIGTSSPDSPLEVVATNDAMKISGTGVSSTGLVFETNGVERKQIGIPSGDTALAFYSDAGSSEAMRLDSSGNVGIGTTSLTGKAHIYKSSVNSAIIGTSYSGHYFESQSDDATDGFEIYQKHGSNTTRNSFIVNDNRTGSKSAAFLVRGDGNVGIGTTPSTVLHINDASDPILRLQRGGAAYSQFQSDSAGSLYISADAGDSGGLSRMQFNVDGSERMRIDGSGNVGIGTTSLTQGKLCINGGSDGSSIISGRSDGGNGNNERFKITAFADGGGAGYGGGIGFETRNTVNVFSEAMRINSSGRVLINRTTTAGYQLDVYGDVKIERAGTSATHVVFTNANGNVGTITTSGTSTAYNTSSDHRLKENVTDVTDGITRVKQLEPKRFNFIADPDRTVDGFLAHEAQAVVPEAITGTHNEVEVWTDGEELPDGVSIGDNKLDDDGNTIPKYQGIDQSKLVPLLTAALKEAITKIETLETEMTSVKARLDALEGV